VVKARAIVWTVAFSVLADMSFRSINSSIINTSSIQRTLIVKDQISFWEVSMSLRWFRKVEVL